MNKMNPASYKKPVTVLKDHISNFSDVSLGMYQYYVPFRYFLSWWTVENTVSSRSSSIYCKRFHSPVTRISQWISSYRSSSTLLSMAPDPGEAINCCWCLCNWPWSLVTLSSNKLRRNSEKTWLQLNSQWKITVTIHEMVHYNKKTSLLPCKKRYTMFGRNSS